ncbi:Tetratricopeptide TPR_2 repeat protein [Rippkaea orientalis PCC 8801]|uniref:Tetratricopeptide TPR_2 repeat protein n=1 Tax=Rippkaea orientalis (strain PCC 8801 / RF-1) TaxID=41431 RepID=B7K1R3_RIPO1|nr:tetratricopeptide repeat protein [Rippkaea orientalis]ACK67605.1 Tetratricopeptide TPR_2 repeat protein [Rippkaea orientalis PCC 8801]
MSEGFEFDVFLAHNSVDKPHVREISNKLRERGLKPWLDEEQIPPGMSFQDEIQKAIPLIKSAAIIIGTQGLGKWQIMELRSLITKFVNLKIPVIPVLLPGVNNIPGDLLFLQELNWVKFEQIDDATAFYRLEWGITQVKPELHPKTVQLTAEEWFNLGYNKGESGDNQGAIADFNQAIKIKSDLAEAYYNRGLAKSNLGDYQGAISDYNQAIEIKPDYAAAYNNRGLTKYNLGDNQGAITDYTQAIEIKPDDADAYYNRGLAKYNLGDKQGAIADYNQAIKIKPDYATAYNNRGNAKYNLGDKQGAIADYNQAIKIKPDYTLAYICCGLAKSNLGDNQGAITDYNQAIKIKPDYADAYICRGNAKKNLGDNQGAIADYNQAAQLYSQQNNMEWYLKALEKIKKLEQ